MPKCWCVLDGATTLFEEQTTVSGSIASELVEYTKTHLPQLLEEYSFIDAIKKISIESFKHFKFKTDEPARLPTMGLAAVVSSGKYFTFYLLGDVEISYKTVNDNVYRFKDESVKKLDDEVINLMHKEKLSREELLPKLINNRNQLGKAYQAFIPSINPNFQFVIKRVLKSNIKNIKIYSDGYYSLKETFKIVKNHEDFMNYNINEAVRKIVIAAYKDPELTKYPRLKLIDDITVIELTKKEHLTAK